MKAKTSKPKRGAPTMFAAKMRKVLVTLDPASIAKAKKLGDGNLSAGIRQGIDSMSGVKYIIPYLIVPTDQ